MTLEKNITDPTRAKNFAQFFKNYMSIWSVVVAALPIPITSFGLIPVFEFQKGVFSTYTTLFCFLLLGYIFYSRHRIAKFFFPEYYLEKQKINIQKTDYAKILSISSEEAKQVRLFELEMSGIRNRYLATTSKIYNALPGILILLSLSSAFSYNYVVEDLISGHRKYSDLTRYGVLQNVSLSSYGSSLLMISYLGIFIFAEAAFILMAIKEYLQDLLQISDKSLMMDMYLEDQQQEEITVPEKEIAPTPVI